MNCNEEKELKALQGKERMEINEYNEEIFNVCLRIKLNLVYPTYFIYNVQKNQMHNKKCQYMIYISFKLFKILKNIL